MDYSINCYDIDFGGQNQIVNQQEQNREVNQGGLTQTDSGQNLYGEKKEEPDPTGKIKKDAEEDEKELEEDVTPEIEAPVKKQLENE